LLLKTLRIYRFVNIIPPPNTRSERMPEQKGDSDEAS
jgi:hypothetical protein